MLLLIESLELLSDQKSFVLGIANAKKKIWLLLHLKNLKIKTYKLHYRVNNGIRQRAKTVHPIRQMRKKFSSTAQLLGYLNYKSYDLLYIEIFFENGWSFKEQSNHYFSFYTNSIHERNELINKFTKIAGYELVPLKDLSLNITYFLSFLGEFYDFDLGVNPDEFWSKEKTDDWVNKWNKKNSSASKNISENFEPIEFTNTSLKEIFKELNLDELNDPPF
tara:strand:- start:869 stop:1528 length:660 start_codon:yes stop_codon:yes gene_type:complete